MASRIGVACERLAALFVDAGEASLSSPSTFGLE